MSGSVGSMSAPGPHDGAGSSAGRFGTITEHQSPPMSMRASGTLAYAIEASGIVPSGVEDRSRSPSSMDANPGAGGSSATTSPNVTFCSGTPSSGVPSSTVVHPPSLSSGMELNGIRASGAAPSAMRASGRSARVIRASGVPARSIDRMSWASTVGASAPAPSCFGCTALEGRLASEMPAPAAVGALDDGNSCIEIPVTSTDPASHAAPAGRL
ncbi:MAG: hypothetical protein ABW328_18840 [Ilumatobacteraceae bacterium]